MGLCSETSSPLGNNQKAILELAVTFPGYMAHTSEEGWSEHLLPKNKALTDKDDLQDKVLKTTMVNNLNGWLAVS